MPQKPVNNEEKLARLLQNGLTDYDISVGLSIAVAVEMFSEGGPQSRAVKEARKLAKEDRALFIRMFPKAMGSDLAVLLDCCEATISNVRNGRKSRGKK